MAAEHGFYVGGVGVYVWCEYGDVVRLPVGMAGEQGNQVVF